MMAIDSAPRADAQPLAGLTVVEIGQNVAEFLADQRFSFFYCVCTCADNRTVETGAYFFAERISIRFTPRPIWF